MRTPSFFMIGHVIEWSIIIYIVKLRYWVE